MCLQNIADDAGVQEAYAKSLLRAKALETEKLAATGAKAATQKALAVFEEKLMKARAGVSDLEGGAVNCVLCT